jgi:hypothetical protein
LGWESGEVTGTVTESTEDYIQIAQEGKNYPKKLWIGRQYEGDKPGVGVYGSFSFDTAPPPEGRKYGSSYLSGYQALTPPVGSQNGQAPTEPKHFVGRDPAMADFWQATRWAWSLAAEMLSKTGKEPSVTSIAELAGEVFQASYSEALKHKEWATSIGEEA